MTQTTTNTWATLPLEIRELLSHEDTVGKIEAIGAKQGLRSMEQGFLVRITANLMRGEIPPNMFVDTLSDELDIPRDKAAYLAQEINRDIFSSVKEALKQVHATGEKVAKLDPSLVTCIPGEMSATAAAGNRAPGNAGKIEPVGSIFEQKLGGAFRMKGESVSSTGIAPPTLITPPPPQPTRQTVPSTASKIDPYREQPV